MTEKIYGDGAFRRESLQGSTIENTYAGALSFMRRRYTRDLSEADVVVSGVPLDLATTFRPGARLGPAAIRAASVQLAELNLFPWGFDPFDDLAVIDYGDCWFDAHQPWTIRETIKQHALDIIQNSHAKMLTFGGDHFITYPLLKAHAKKHGPLALVHFDAHRDIEPDGGGRIDHGTMFGYAVREGLIDPHKSVQIGIRTSFLGETGMGFRIIFADEVHDKPAQELADIIAKKVGKTKAYLTFDIDCLDPSAAPGTGTPIPGGLTYHQAASIIRKLTNINFVAMDMVEVSPPFDHAELTSLAASALIGEYLCLKAWQKGARATPMKD